MAERATFYVKYEGPATAGGRIDVRFFAPALQALGEACQEANRVLNGSKRTEVNVFIQADLKDGSFEVTLEVVMGILDASQSWLGDNPTAAEIINLLGLAGITAQEAVVKSALAIWKFYRGRRPVKREQQPDGNIKITNHDGQVIIADERAVVLVDNKQINNNYYNFTFPVTVPGIDRLEVGSGDGRTDAVTPQDVPEYHPEDLDDPAEPLLESTVVDVVEIVTPAFRPKMKWRLSRGGPSFPAAMTDPDFLSRVEAGEAFRKGDFLKARIHSSVREEDGSTRLQHEVVHVLDHLPGKRAGKQESIFPADEES